MDVEITVESEEGLRVRATDGRHVVVMDEPETAGGTDRGMTPVQVLLASLASCAAITMRMYAQRKGWALEGSTVQIGLDRASKEAPARVVQRIALRGNLGEAERERLREVAGRCPVHRLVEGPLTMEEHLA